MKNIYLAQVNNLYGNQCFLPYSVGLLQAHAQTNELINENFKFCDLFYLREPLDQIISKIKQEPPDIFGISCYIWNWSYNQALAKAIKQTAPNCLIIVGGPQIPVNSNEFFKEYPFIDIIVHYEGELAFTEILLEKLNKEDYQNIAGLSIRASDNSTIKTKQRERLSNLDLIPSPYLNGVFDKIISNKQYSFHASQETHRGCPYECTFCDWGSNIYAKVKQFGTDRLVKEFEWFARNKIELLYNCDANYGLFNRDIELTKTLVDLKQKYGYPCKFRAAYAKNSNETVFEIAKILNNAEMNKGITLSFQSMDANTLEIIKRKNIKIENFQNLMERYHQSKIATYSELIIGLPGESYDTFADGINTLIECGQHDSIQVWNCEILPNAEMNNSIFKEKYKIKTIKTPVLFFHACPSTDEHQEYYELVIGTSTLSGQDWLKTHIFSCFIQGLHCLGITQYLARFLNKYLQINYQQFYESIITFAENNSKSLLGQELIKIKNILNNLQIGKDWGTINKKYGDVIWPPEEALFLTIIDNKKQFYEEIFSFIKKFIGEEELIQTILDYQSRVVKSPNQNSEILETKYNINEYLHSAVDLLKKQTKYMIKAKFYNNLDFAKNVIWYGRKGSKCLNEATVL